jgi:hypothetical protein
MESGVRPADDHEPSEHVINNLVLSLEPLVIRERCGELTAKEIGNFPFSRAFRQGTIKFQSESPDVYGTVAYKYS